MKSIMPCLFLFLQRLHSGKEHIEGVIPAIQGLYGTAIAATEQVAEKFLLLGKQTTHSQRKALCSAKLTQRQGPLPPSLPRCVYAAPHPLLPFAAAYIIAHSYKSPISLLF